MNALHVKKDDFYLPTLQVLRDMGGSASIEEIEEKLIERFEFTQSQLDVVYETSGDNVITDKMSWARSYLKFPNYLSNDTRGVWVLTEVGREAADMPFDTVREAIRLAKAKRRTAQLAERKAATYELDAILGQNGLDQEDVEEASLDWTDALLPPCGRWILPHSSGLPNVSCAKVGSCG